MENKRMTWDEIVAKYPDQWVGLIEEEGAGPNVTSAIVVCAYKNADDILAEQIKNHDIYAVYTTPDNLDWIDSGLLSYADD